MGFDSVHLQELRKEVYLGNVVVDQKLLAFEFFGKLLRLEVPVPHQSQGLVHILHLHFFHLHRHWLYRLPQVNRLLLCHFMEGVVDLPVLPAFLLELLQELVLEELELLLHGSLLDQVLRFGNVAESNLIALIDAHLDGLFGLQNDGLGAHFLRLWLMLNGALDFGGDLVDDFLVEGSVCVEVFVFLDFDLNLVVLVDVLLDVAHLQHQLVEMPLHLLRQLSLLLQVLHFLLEVVEGRNEFRELLQVLLEKPILLRHQENELLQVVYLFPQFVLLLRHCIRPYFFLLEALLQTLLLLLFLSTLLVELPQLLLEISNFLLALFLVLVVRLPDDMVEVVEEEGEQVVQQMALFLAFVFNRVHDDVQDLAAFPENLVVLSPLSPPLPLL